MGSGPQFGVRSGVALEQIVAAFPLGVFVEVALGEGLVGKFADG